MNEGYGALPIILQSLPDVMPHMHVADAVKVKKGKTPGDDADFAMPPEMLVDGLDSSGLRYCRICTVSCSAE